VGEQGHGRDAGFGQPVARQVAAARGVILGHVAGDVGELEGDAEVRGAVERVLVGRGNAHHRRHHHPHRAGDVVAVAQHVGLALRAPAIGIEREAGEDVLGHGAGHATLARQEAECVEGGIVGLLAGERAWVSARIVASLAAPPD
jgi:hypothetical protein